MSSESNMAFQLDEEDGNVWIVTFADIMTLILVFFILLYTLANFETTAYRNMVDSVQILDGDGHQISVIDYATSQGRNPEPLQIIEDMLGLNPADVPIDTMKPVLVSELESMIDNTDLADSVDLVFDGDQINLSIDGSYIFTSGSAVLKKEAEQIFAQLGSLFRRHSDYRISVKGHTDDLDIETVQFPSNWELSAVRATTVLRYFIAEGIDPERMTATGYADFLPLVENDSAENRAKNRRVEFVLEKEKES